MTEYLHFRVKTEHLTKPSDLVEIGPGANPGPHFVYEGVVLDDYFKYFEHFASDGSVIGWYEVEVYEAFEARPAEFLTNGLEYNGVAISPYTDAWRSAGDEDFNPDPTPDPVPDPVLNPTLNLPIPDDGPISEPDYAQLLANLAAQIAKLFPPQYHPDVDFSHLLNEGHFGLYAGMMGISYSEAVEEWQSRLNGDDGAPFLRAAAKAGAASTDQVLDTLERTFWASERQTISLLKNSLIQEGYGAAEIEIITKAYGGFAFGLTDNPTEVVIGNSTVDNEESFGWIFGTKAYIAGSVLDDHIYLPTGGTVYFGDGNDELLQSYSDGATTAVGGNGNDVLRGSFRKDNLRGDAGKDSLFGSAGRDQLSGGAGKDHFYYAATSDSKVGVKRDVITDFVHGKDDIDLSEWSDQLFHYTGKGSKFDGYLGSIIWHQVNKPGAAADYTLIQISTDFDAKPEMEIELRGLIKLTAADFII